MQRGTKALASQKAEGRFIDLRVLPATPAPLFHREHCLGVWAIFSMTVVFGAEQERLGQSVAVGVRLLPTQQARYAPQVYFGRIRALLLRCAQFEYAR